MSEPTEQQYADPRCSGITKEGRQCLAPFPMWRSPDGRLWCSPHRPQAGGEVERWSPEGNVEALDPERRCLGRMHDGSTQCPAVSTTSVVIDQEKLRVCAWHKRLFNDYGVLQPPSKTRRAVPEVDPLPEEDEPAPTQNGNGGPVSNGDSGMSMRERIERSTEENYAEIEAALRRALQGSTKPRGVKCPACGEGFRVNLPDFGPAIASAKLLLELVVSRPRPPEEERPMPPLTDDLDLGSLSTAELYRVAFGKEPPRMPAYEDEDEVAS